MARPLIKNLLDVPPNREFEHEIIQGIEGRFPPLKGFVMTTVKDNPLVEQVLVSPDPSASRYGTVLATWNYGLGRTAAFTTDAGKRWATQWTTWPEYDKFFTQLIRWSMRPNENKDNFQVSTQYQDGKVQLAVSALNEDDEFINFLEMAASATGPDLKSKPIKIRQTAPGRYVGEFEADQSGGYFVTVVPGAGSAPLITGVSVPYSEEFRDRKPNLPLLTSLASLKPAGGKPGRMVEGELSDEGLEQLLEVDSFRHDLSKAISRQDIWTIILLLNSQML